MAAIISPKVFSENFIHLGKTGKEDRILSNMTEGEWYWTLIRPAAEDSPVVETVVDIEVAAVVVAKTVLGASVIVVVESMIIGTCNSRRADCRSTAWTGNGGVV